MNRSIRSALAVACLLTAATCLPLAAAPKDDLLSAASDGETAKLAGALAAGAKPDARDAKGRTALMLAAGAESFACCRELLWAGADVTLKDKAGKAALDFIEEPSDENQPLRILLRCYAYLRDNAKRATARPARPSLAMIMEPTVNYMHPQLKSLYYVNQAELKGAAGKDDDKNGFIDDVYGWSPVNDSPYKIAETVFNAYLKNRDAVARIVGIDNALVEGRITPEEAELKLAEHSNPLSDIMGQLPELTDDSFLNMIKSAGHGSHVAGIIADASEGKAQLHTIGLNFSEESRRRFGPKTTSIIDEIHTKSYDVDVVMGELRARLLAHNTARGRMASRYMQSVGAGVANLSFGGGPHILRGFAAANIVRCIEAHAELDPSAAIEDDEIERLVDHWSLELYIAEASELALLFFENPDVLFVVSAGNDDANNDELLPYPAYLSRFFPNVTTVAATNADDSICSFSNYGVDSVNIGAPGRNIRSTIIPETPCYMNGTSMAAPYVTGVAAYVRTLAPKITAAELRQLIDYSARDVVQLHRYTSAGGAIDKAAMRDLYTGDDAAKAAAHARIAVNAALLSDRLYPRHAADAESHSKEAIRLAPKSADAWRSRSITLSRVGEFEQAVSAIDRALEIEPGFEPGWFHRAELYVELEDAMGVISSLDKSIALLATEGEDSDITRSQRLVMRASVYFAIGESEAARQDVVVARAINAGILMQDELEALLPSAE